MVDKKQFFIVYFPYLNMCDTPQIDFGFLKIWNFSKLKEKYFPDNKIRSRVELILGTYLDRDNNPMQGIGVISINEGDHEFREFTSSELEQVRLAKLMLFLAFLSRNNTEMDNMNAGLYMATAENFTLRYHRFNLEDNHTGEIDGYIIEARHIGLKIGAMKYLIPVFVLKPLNFIIDEDLLSWLSKLHNKKPRVFNKIINATELFFESYYNSISVSKNARILLQTSAFEILLSLKDREARKDFKKKVEKETVLPGDKKYKHYYETYKAGRKQEQLTRKGIWADHFYTLRNHIIHGHMPPNSEYNFRKQRHIDIALIFFIFFVKKLIEQGFRRHLFDQEIRWGCWKDAESGKSRSGFLYETSLISTMGRIKRALKTLKKRP